MDCSVIAATNRNLENLCNKGDFRQDLFYRLNTFTIQIPPLRERPDDIFALINYYLNKYNKLYRKNKRITHDALDQFLSYSFPGNVRELKNIIKRSVVMGENNVLNADILNGSRLRGATELSLKTEMLKLEKEILSKAQLKYNTIRAIADGVGIHHSSVIRKLKKHGLMKES